MKAGVSWALSPGTHRFNEIGHGKGKANEMLNLEQFWERKRSDIAHKVVGAIDSDLESLTQDQVLALVRDWFEQNREFI